jgi:hypothetical protein
MLSAAGSPDALWLPLIAGSEPDGPYLSGADKGGYSWCARRATATQPVAEQAGSHGGVTRRGGWR